MVLENCWRLKIVDVDFDIFNFFGVAHFFKSLTSTIHTNLLLIHFGQIDKSNQFKTKCQIKHTRTKMQEHNEFYNEETKVFEIKGESEINKQIISVFENGNNQLLSNLYIKRANAFLSGGFPTYAFFDARRSFTLNQSPESYFVASVACEKLKHYSLAHGNLLCYMKELIKSFNGEFNKHHQQQINSLVTKISELKQMAEEEYKKSEFKSSNVLFTPLHPLRIELDTTFSSNNIFFDTLSSEITTNAKIGEWKKHNCRGVFATTDIQPGEVISRELPFATGSVHLDSCANCLKKLEFESKLKMESNKKLIRCSNENCCFEFYCSEHCMNEAKEKWHNDLICGHNQNNLIEFVDRGTTSASRILILILKLFGIQETARLEPNNSTAQKLSKLISLLSSSRMFGKEMFLPVETLNNHAKSTAETICKHGHPHFDHKRYIDLFAIAQVNAFTFQSDRLSEFGVSGAVGICSFSSFYNHKCNSNAEHIVEQIDGSQYIVVRALNHIKTGEQIFIQYGDKIDGRHQTIQYGFECECNL